MSGVTEMSSLNFAQAGNFEACAETDGILHVEKTCAATSGTSQAVRAQRVACAKQVAVVTAHGVLLAAGAFSLPWILDVLMFNAADTQLYAYLLGIEDGLPDALGYTQVAVPLLMMAFLFMRFVMNTAKLTKDARVAAFAAKPAARFAQAALLWVSSVGFALSVTLHVLARIIVVLNERLIGIPFYDEYPFGCAQEDTAELLAVVLFSIVVCTVVCAVFGSLRCKPNKRGRIRRAANALRMRPTARWVMLTAAVTTSAITVPAAIAALVVAAALALSVAVMILGLALAVVLLPLMIPLCFAAMRNA